MEVCVCAGITLVGKFTNKIINIENNYSSNKKACEIIKMLSEYKSDKSKLESLTTEKSILAPLLRFEYKTLTRVADKHYIRKELYL